MKFYFCQACGVRVTEDDIDDGFARNKKLKGVYCSQCAVGVTTMESLPVTNEEAKKLLDADDRALRPAATPASVPRGARKTSGVRIPSANRASSSRMPRSATATQHSGNRFLIPAIGAAAVVVVIGLVVFSGSGQKPSRKARARKADAKRDHVPRLPKTHKKDKISRTAEVGPVTGEAPPQASKPRPTPKTPPKTVAQPSPTTTSYNPEGWEDLLADRTLQGWQVTRGKWTFVNEFLQGIPGKGMARIETKAHYKDFDLEAAVLVEKTRYAEVQIRDNGRSYPIGHTPGKWVRVKVTARGQNVSVTVDGKEMQPDTQDGARLSGWIALYVKTGGTIKVKELKVQRVNDGTPVKNMVAKGDERQNATATESNTKKPTEKPEEEHSKPQEDLILAKAERLTRRQAAFRKLVQGETAEARRLLKNMQSENESHKDLQSVLAKDLQLVGMMQEIFEAVPKGILVLRDERPFTIHMSGGKSKIEVGKGSRNTVKELKDDRIVIEMDMGGGSAQIPIELSRLKTQSRIELGRMGLGKKAGSLHHALARCLLAQAKGETPDLNALRRKLKASEFEGDQVPLAEHLIEVVEGMSREVMARRSLDLIKEACTRKSWKEATILFEKFAKEHGDSAFAAKNKSLLEDLKTEVEYGLFPEFKKYEEALKNPSNDTKTLQRVAPGFVVAVPGFSVGFLSGRAVTHPPGTKKPCVLRNVLRIPPGKTTKLMITVSGRGTADWKLVVRVNGDSVFEKIMTGENNLEIDLTRFSDKKILLDLEHHGVNAWHSEHANWGKIEVVSE